MDQPTTAPAHFTHSPTLRVGDMVEFNCGDHAGICGELIRLSLVTNRVVVITQNDEVLEGRTYEVNKVAHE